MPIAKSTLAFNRADIVVAMLAELTGAIPDAYVDEDGILRIMFEVEAGQFENIFLANQILLEDCFPQTASYSALLLHGNMYGIAQKVGQMAEGNVTFIGDGGTGIPAGSLVGAPRGLGLQPILFYTTADVEIPDPGIPTPPTTAVNVAAGNLNGSYEYKTTFVNAAGETMPSVESQSVDPVNEQVDLTEIPLGGTGTTKRRIYRRLNGVDPYRRVTEIANNTATTYTDNIAEGALGVTAPTIDTAHSVDADVIAQSAGTNGNASPGTVTILASIPPGITSVTNAVAFTGGSEDETIEAYRQRMLTEIADPQTGSPDDLKAWAISVQGVDSATVFANDNLGVATNGHVTVRISGPGASIPDAEVVAEVLALLQSYDIANITIHVATFTPKNQDVTVDVTTDSTHTLGDVTPSVQAAIADYIDALAVGGTCYKAGIIDCVFELPGIIDVSVTSPATNQTSLATEKFVSGTITVT